MPKRLTRVLTEPQLRRLVAAGEPVAKSDGDGLTFTLSAKHVATWILRYRYRGRRRELSLGRYPDLSLRAARDTAAKHRVLVQEGHDVATEKQRRKQQDGKAWTVKELLRDYERCVVPGLAESTAFGMLNYLAADILPTLGSRLLADVTIDDACSIIERAAKRSYWAGVNTRKAGIALFKHAELKRLISRNPFTAVRMIGIAAKPKVRRRIALADVQIAVLLNSLNRIGPRDAALVELLLRTGVRISEALTAEWADIHWERAEWRIPREKIKTRKGMADPSFDIHLHPSTLAVFERLRSLSDGSRWVFPALVGAADAGGRSMDHERALARLKAHVATLGNFPAIVFHDLRSTVRSGMRVIGERIEVCERALNHRLPGLPAIYDIVQKDQLDRAFERWGDHLDTLVRRGEVVPFPRKVP